MTAGGSARPAVATADPGQEGALRKRDQKHTTKEGQILAALARGESLTRLEAWTRFGHSALNSAVSTLQRRHGLQVSRERVRVQGVHGPAWVCRYWLTEAERDRADRILLAAAD